MFDLLSKVVKNGENFPLEKTISISHLQIEEGAAVTAPEGKTVTMVANGVETAIQPGTYENVTLAVAEGFRVGPRGPADFRTGLYLGQAGTVLEKSVMEAFASIDISEREIQNVKVRSVGTSFTPIFADGGSYHIRNMEAELNGHAEMDKGVALVVADNADLTVDGLKLRTCGIGRAATIVSGNSKLVVKNADIITAGGTPEEEAARSPEKGPSVGVPWPLGIFGNNRSTNVVNKAHATYIDSVIKADRWGVLSTDAVSEPEKIGDICVTLDVKNCDVEVYGDSGYGSYSIGACRNTFEHTRIKVPDYGVIVANEYCGADFTDGCVVDSGRFCLMFHQNQGGVTRIQDSAFTAGQTAFLIKGCYPKLEVTNSTVEAKGGIILQMMDSDDPQRLEGTRFFVDTATAERQPDHDPTNLNYHDVMMYHRVVPNYCTDAQAIFSGMTLAGDFYNGTTNAHVYPLLSDDLDADHGQRPDEVQTPYYPTNLALDFRNTTVQGVISAANTRHYVDEITKATRIEIGHVWNTPAPVVNNGVLVSIDAKSTWKIPGTCYLSSLHLEEGGQILAVDNKTLHFEVNGETLPLLPGTYKGNIVLSVD